MPGRGRPFPPGQSGNPAGGRKLARHTWPVARDILHKTDPRQPGGVRAEARRGHADEEGRAAGPGAHALQREIAADHDPHRRGFVRRFSDRDGDRDDLVPRRAARPPPGACLRPLTRSASAHSSGPPVAGEHSQDHRRHPQHPGRCVKISGSRPGPPWRQARPALVWRENMPR
jgi:hypothetical protein